MCHVRKASEKRLKALESDAKKLGGIVRDKGWSGISASYMGWPFGFRYAKWVPGNYFFVSREQALNHLDASFSENEVECES